MSSIGESALGVLSDFGLGVTPELEALDDDSQDLPDLLPVSDPDDPADPDFEDPDESGSLELPDDPEALKAQVVKLQRKAEHEAKLRVETGMKLWRQEATEHYPYSRPEQITAQSRTDFLRQAKQRDADFRTQAAPILARLKAEQAAKIASEVARIQAEKDKGWGIVTVGSTPGIPEGHEAREKLEVARSKRDLKGVARALMDGGGI